MAIESYEDFLSLKSAGDPSIARLYRAHVQPQGWRGIECTAFVEAANHSAAARKIAAAVAALEYGSTAEAVFERIYNVTSGIDLIAEGISTDYGPHLFETGWSGQDVLPSSSIRFSCLPMLHLYAGGGRGSLNRAIDTRPDYPGNICQRFISRAARLG